MSYVWCGSEISTIGLDRMGSSKDYCMNNIHQCAKYAIT